MIHEILIDLLHNSDDSLGKLDELQEFLHPGEKQLLHHIMEISSNHNWIVSFCKKIQNCSVDQHGLYIKAFVNGVLDVLGDYKSEIVRLEDLFLQNPELQLIFISSCLEKYQVLFNVIMSIIQVVEKDRLHGCLLMGRLHKYIYCGVEPITQAAKKITHCFNSIFYRHLCNWIIYGDLVDLYKEFFISDGECWDEDFLYPEQNEESTLTRVKHRIKRPPPVRKFTIVWSMVPMFITEDTAESILFMGRIVWIVKNHQKTNTDNYQNLHKPDVWDGKDIEYYKKIQALETQIFDQMEFQRVIEECRIKLTKYLWSVMVDEGDLKEHLQLIRDYYALGRGELFHQFIEAAENQTTSYNLNVIFLETARKIYGENDKTYLRFELAKLEKTSVNPWSKLQLNFEISWPLHIIFNPKSMELYNQLFCYLLRLSRTQIHLHKLWQAHMSGKQNIDRRVWTLRQHLIFLVNNLQYYLQVDVIEAQFSLLLKAIENASEFEEIIKVHHEFISNLLAKTFILTPDKSHTYQNKHRLHQTPAVQFNVPSEVYNVIIQLLELCDNFCVIASTWQPQLTEPEVTEFEQFQKRTDTIVDSLLFILYKLHERADGQHLVQLLHQLDFNRFFTRNKPEFNLTQRT
ncbi:Gamma-tubulin complex component 4 homolog-like Protein [Tribolium castaneum]|uniref:Gamma-tubulin complex component n=1 Tax=Tribolium castaneum TaxID=7070 RepID=D6WTG1_TRICA|nr:PREDICTED: gamma-tubulin complex component 4 [Tribolium castaneum]EFA06296.1 Gamma-tubulin complex component 4 homolog-like Protein [Tribolium castaneum]|eukprot:XP_973997.3 PREDICTED: gamma-tubulin complex component 4 [Tribolium castaneum]